MTNKAKGITLMLLSALCFSFMGILIKFSGEIPVFEKIFFTNAVTAFIFFITLKVKNESYFGDKENRKYIFGRCFLGYISMVFNFIAISELALADASMLSNISPFFVTIFAMIFLKEKIKKIQIPILISTFLGALLIIKPAFNLNILPALSGVGCAFFGAGAYTVISFLSGKVNKSILVFNFSFFSVLVSFILMLRDYQYLSINQYLILILMGLFWTLGQFFLTAAYQYAPASEVSVYTYSNILFSAVLAFMFIRELPDLSSMVGGAIIVLAGVFNYYYDKKAAIVI